MVNREQAEYLALLCITVGGDEGAGEKELLGFKIFIWVVSFWELAPWKSCLSQGAVAGQRVPRAMGTGVGHSSPHPAVDC